VNVVNRPTTPEGGPASRDDLPAIDREGVKAWAQCGLPVTVVSVSGDIDASNVGHVTAYVSHSVRARDALLVDMTGVGFFAVQGISMLIAVENTCRSTKLPWALVASPAVQRVLRLGKKADLPVANSVPAAMQYFTHLSHMLASPRRTRGLLPTPATTAAGPR